MGGGRLFAMGGGGTIRGGRRLLHLHLNRAAGVFAVQHDNIVNRVFQCGYRWRAGKHPTAEQGYRFLTLSGFTDLQKGRRLRPILRRIFAAIQRGNFQRAKMNRIINRGGQFFDPGGDLIQHLHHGGGIAAGSFNRAHDSG